MLKFYKVIIVLLSSIILVACGDPSTVNVSYDDMMKGKDQPTENTNNKVFMPVLSYTLEVRDNRAVKFQYLTVLYKENLLILELIDNRFKYSPKLREFEGAFVKANINDKGAFYNLEVITAEEYEEEVSNVEK